MDNHQQDPCNYNHRHDWILYLLGAAALGYLVILGVTLFG